MNIWKRNWKSRISDYITIVDLNVDYIFIFDKILNPVLNSF